MKKFTKLWRSFLLISMAWAAISVSGQVVEKNNTRQKTFQMTEKQISAEKSIKLNEESKAFLKKQGINEKLLNDPEIMLKAEEMLKASGLLEETSIINKELPTDAASGYSFSESTGSYTEITGGTLVSASNPSNTLDDVNFSGQIIPFTFNFNGIDYTEFNINTNGNITFGSTLPSTYNPSPISSSTAYSGAISAFSRDLDGRTLVQADVTTGSDVLTNVSHFGPVVVGEEITGTGIPTGTTILSFDSGSQTITISQVATSDATATTCIIFSAELRTETTGTAPNRVHIIQYKNFKRFGSSTYFGDMVNFQIRLYETSNVIELVYGDNVFGYTSTTVQVGLRGASNTDYNNRTTTTDWSATTAGATNSASCTISPTVLPSQGYMFAFTPPITPGDPYNPSPANLATAVSVIADLTWSFGANTTTYDLYFGTDNPPLTKVADNLPSGATGTYDPGTMGYSTTYYWQVVAKGPGGETTGSIWSFTTSTNLPYAATNPSPASGSSGVAIDANLTWDFGLNTETYDVLLSTVNPPVDIVVADATASGPSGSFDPPADLANNTEYFWQIVSKNAAKAEIAGPVWSFFTECETVTVLPFFEGFNSASTTESCWTVLNVNGDGDAWNLNYTTNPYEGDQVAVMYTDFNSGNNDDYLISPKITLTGNEQLSFWQRVNSSGEPNDFEVLLSTTGNAPADFTNTILANASYANTTYEEIVIDLSAYSGDVFIAWRVAPGGLDGWILYIDAVDIDVIPTCPKPLSLLVDNIDATTADFSWNPQGTETIWNVEIGLTGFLPGTGNEEQSYIKTVSGEPTPTITQSLIDLAGSTIYDAYVQADCGTDEVSEWAGPFTFTTLCATVNTFPYLEDFEGTFAPICWERYSGLLADPSVLSSITYGWYQNDYQNIVGDMAATVNIWSTGANYWLVTPEIDLGTGGYQLEFDLSLNAYGSSGAADPGGVDDKFAIIISTDGGVTWTSANTLRLYDNAGSPFVYDNINSAGEHVVLDVTAYTGIVKFAFYGESTVSNADNELFVNNVQVRVPPACPEPTALSVENNIGGNIDLVWNSNSGLSDVEWGVNPLSQGSGAMITGATGGTTTITGLTTGETYDFYVMDDCGGGSTSSWVGPYTFTYYPQPANDLCSSSQPVNGPYPVSGIAGTTLGASLDCPTFLNLPSGEVWYAIDLPYAHNYIVLDIYGDALLDDGWIIGTDVQCSCDAADYYYAVDWNFSAPNVTGLTWEDVPGPGTFYYPMATGTYQENFTFDVNVTGPPVVDPAPLSLNNTLVENQNGSEDLAIGNIGGFDLAYMANIQYSGGTETASPSNVDYWTGSTDGTTFTDVSEVRCIGDAESGWMRFDVSGVVLPPGAIISSIELNCYVNATNWPYWYINNLTSDPLITDPATLDTEIRDVTEYYNYNTESSTYAAGWKLYELGGNAITDFETALGSGWFALGLFDEDGGTSYYVNFDGHNDANPPYLTITYVVGATGWLSLNGGESVTGDVLAGDPADQIMVGFDAAGLAPDVYTANIRVTSNDPVTPIMDVPVTLTVVAGIAAELTVLLEGPYDAAGTMFQTLNSGGYIPLNQPYNPSLPYYGNVAPKWLYAGTESVAAIPTDVVDWVVVQVRDAADAASASSATIEAEQAAFVLADGSIVGLDGMSRLGFAGVTIDNGLFMVVYHRNHLGVMSATALTNVGGFYDYDFSSAETQVYGGANGHKDLGDGYWGMIAADGDANGLIQATDETGAWKTDLGASGYLGGDFDMNGLGQGTDETGYWVPNLGGGGQVPAKASDTGYQSQIPK